MKAAYLDGSDELLVLGCGDEIDPGVLSKLLTDCSFKRIPQNRRVMARFRTYAQNYNEVLEKVDASGESPDPDALYWNYRVCYKRATLEAMWKRLHGASFKEDVVDAVFGSRPLD